METLGYDRDLEENSFKEKARLADLTKRAFEIGIFIT